MRTCAFCGPTNADLSREHVWPEWLSSLFADAGIGDYTVARIAHASRARRWKASTLSLKVGGICTTCNNRRLSGLENDRVKPVLSLAAFGKSIVLSQTDQAALASWATRMAMVYEFASPSPFFFTAEDRCVFIETLKAPHAAQIWVFQLRSRERTAVGFSQGHIIDRAARDSWLVSTGVTGSFGFQMLTRRTPGNASGFWDDRLFAQVEERWASALAQIWPYVQEVRWPPMRYLTDDHVKPLCERWGGTSVGLRQAFS